MSEGKATLKRPEDSTAGTWSRRLTQEHRIVYLVKEEQIHFLQARYHYWRDGAALPQRNGRRFVTRWQRRMEM